MKPFSYERASGVAAACASAAEPTAKFIAGGTNLIDLMKLQIETPARLVDIGALPLGDIEETHEGGLRIGALVTNSALAAMHSGDEITTIEGLAHGDELHPMQAAFVSHDGLQCGYCTPGQICSSVAMLAEHKAGWPSYATADMSSHPDLTHAEIAERMSGNICRCSAYANIVAAIREVADGGRA